MNLFSLRYYDFNSVKFCQHSAKVHLNKNRSSQYVIRKPYNVNENSKQLMKALLHGICVEVSGSEQRSNEIIHNGETILLNELTSK